MNSLHFKSKINITLVVALGLCMIFIIKGITNAQSGGTFTLVWYSIDGGASSSAGGSYALRGTLGQPEGALSSGGSFTLRGGVSNSTLPVVIVPSGAAVAPIRNYYVIRNIPLAWSRVSWATGYEVQVSKTTTFTIFAYQNNMLTLDMLSVITTPLLDNGVYYWRVCAKKSNGTCDTWSPVQSFRVDAP